MRLGAEHDNVKVSEGVGGTQKATKSDRAFNPSALSCIFAKMNLNSCSCGDTDQVLHSTSKITSENMCFVKNLHFDYFWWFWEAFLFLVPVNSWPPE